MAQSQKYCGKVVRKPFALGSKSERDAVMMITPEGGEYVLRRMGGDAYQDRELDRLVGKTICCDGILQGYTLLMSGWEVASAR